MMKYSLLLALGFTATNAVNCASDGSNLDVCDTFTASVTCAASCKAGTWDNTLLVSTSGYSITFPSTSVATQVTFSALTTTWSVAAGTMTSATSGVSYGDIKFTAWTGTAFSFPKLQYVDDFDSIDSDALVTFDLPELLVAREVDIDGKMAALESVKLPKFRCGTFSLTPDATGTTTTQNSKLTSLSLPEFGAGINLNVENTKYLKTISVDAAIYFYDVNIENNEALTQIDLPNLRQISDWLDLFNNPMLKTVNWPKFTMTGYSGDVYKNGYGTATGRTNFNDSPNAESAKLTGIDATIMEVREEDTRSSVGVTFFSIVNFLLLLALVGLSVMFRPKAPVASSGP